MNDKFNSWLSRWRVKRIIAALAFAIDYGMKPEVMEFAKTLEAALLMARGKKKDELLTITVRHDQLKMFITYMVRLQTNKLSLWHRARIGLATLAISSKGTLGETPEDFVARELPKAKSAKDGKIIQIIK